MRWQHSAIPSGVQLSEAEHLLQVCGLHAQNGVIQRSELQRRLSREGLPSYVRDAFEVALVTAGPSDRGEITLDELGQALRLGTGETAKAWTDRLQGRDPLQGQWIDRNVLVSYLEHRLRARERCFGLPRAMLTLVLGLVLVVLHSRDTYASSDVAFTVEAGLGLPDLHGAFPESIRAWLQSPSHGHPHLAARRLRLVGGVHLQLLHSGADWPWWPACRRRARLQLVHDMVMSWGGSGKGSNGFRPRVCAESESGMSGYWLHVLPEESGEEVHDLVGRAWSSRENASVISGLADGVAIRVLVNNSELQHYAVHQLVMRFDSSGLFWLGRRTATFRSKSVWSCVVEGMRSSNAAQLLLTILDAIFILACLPVCEVLKLGRSCTKSGCRSGCAQNANPWMATGCIQTIVVCATAIHLAYCEYLRDGFGLLTSRLPALANPSLKDMLSSSNSTRDEYEQHLENLLGHASLVADAWGELSWYVAMVAGIYCFRFVLALTWNKRFGVVIATFRKTCGQISHLLVIVVIIFCVFALIGYVSFGNRIEAFSSVDRAFASTLLFVRQYRYDEIHNTLIASGGSIGTLWIWSLNVVAVLVLTRMVLAVLFDVYTETKVDAFDVPAAWHEALDIFASRRKCVDQLASCADSQGKLRLHWPSSAPPLSAEQRHVIQRAFQEWSDTRVHDHLVQNGGRDGMVSSATLAKRLGAQGWASQMRLHGMLKCAADWQNRRNAPAISLLDSMRLLGRLDANTQDIVCCLSELDSVLANMRHRGCAGLPYAQLAENVAAHPVEKAKHAQASLSKESMQQHVCGRLAEAEARISRRQDELENHVATICQRVQALQHKRTTSASEQLRRLERLEEQTQTLTSGVWHVLEGPHERFAI